MKLVLFDIDGTLLTAGRAGADAMNIAFHELYQIANGFADIAMSGKTDPLIFQEALRQHRVGAGAEQDYPLFYERYLGHLRRTLRDTRRSQRLMPGVPQVLDALAAHPGVILGLLTGNAATAAQLKLEYFGIWHYFRVGAYGDDDADRNALVPIALARARDAFGLEIPPERTVVIGDTPRDIACARAHNACVVAVATGRYRLELLQAHEPDYCLADLSDVPAILRILTHEASRGDAV